MPRKMSGIAINMIEASIVARSTPMVVLDRATHLYPSLRVVFDAGGTLWLAVTMLTRSARRASRSPDGAPSSRSAVTALGAGTYCGRREQPDRGNLNHPMSLAGLSLSAARGRHAIWDT